MGQTLETDAYSRCHTLEKIIKIHTRLDYDRISGQAHRADAKTKSMFDEVVALAVDQVAEGKVEVQIQDIRRAQARAAAIQISARRFYFPVTIADNKKVVSVGLQPPLDIVGKEENGLPVGREGIPDIPVVRGNGRAEAKRRGKITLVILERDVIPQFKCGPVPGIWKGLGRDRWVGVEISPTLLKSPIFIPLPG